MPGQEKWMYELGLSFFPLLVVLVAKMADQQTIDVPPTELYAISMMLTAGTILEFYDGYRQERISLFHDQETAKAYFTALLFFVGQIVGLGYSSIRPFNILGGMIVVAISIIVNHRMRALRIWPFV